MALWACSILGGRSDRSDHAVNIRTNHAACVVDAASRDEAFGKAMRIALAAYPRRDGWQDHAAAVCPVDNVIDPDRPIVSSSAS
jgi:hypothetical protein